MSVDINSVFDRKETTYHYLEKGSVTFNVKNNYKIQILISEVCISFLVKNEKHPFKTSCNVTIEPDKTAELPSIEFTVGLWAEATILFKPSISYRKMNKEGWSKMKEFVTSSTGVVTATDAPERNQKIFISHSNKQQDAAIVKDMQNLLTKSGFTPYVAEKNPRPGSNLWTKIRDEICSSYLFIVLCTVEGAKSHDVTEEVGLANGSNKKIIPVIENGACVHGSLVGVEHVTLDRKKIDDCIRAVITYAVSYKN